MRPLLLAAAGAFAAALLMPMAATAQPLTCDILRDNGQMASGVPPMVFSLNTANFVATTPNGVRWELLLNDSIYFIWRKVAGRTITVEINRDTGWGRVAVTDDGSAPNIGPVYCRRPARL